MIFVQLFLEFCRVGLFSVGGGLATIPFLTDLGERTGWFTSGQLADMIAISESTPGPMGVNMATYVGFTVGGHSALPGGNVLGAVVATLGLVFPCLVIIMIVAAFLQNFAQLPVVIHAFNGVRACVCALILSSILKLRKSSVVDGPTTAIFAAVLVLAVVGNFVTVPEGAAGAVLGFVTSPVVLVVAAGVAGLCVRAAKGGLRK